MGIAIAIIAAIALSFAIIAGLGLLLQAILAAFGVAVSFWIAFAIIFLFSMLTGNFGVKASK